VSAEIISFVPRAHRERQSNESELFRLSERVDDLVMDHADTAPCKYGLPWVLRQGEHEPA